MVALGDWSSLSKQEQPDRALKHWVSHGALHHLSISFGFGRIPIETMTTIVVCLQLFL